MDRADRAKQFLPFDALKGFREALAEKEKIIVPKMELSDYAKEVLDRKLHQVKKNRMITVVYFKDGEYLKMTGMVSRMDGDARLLKVVNTKIAFEDIEDISGEEIVEEVTGYGQ